jgi:hypothetical protein
VKDKMKHPGKSVPHSGTQGKGPSACQHKGTQGMGKATHSGKGAQGRS